MKDKKRFRITKLSAVAAMPPRFRFEGQWLFKTGHNTAFIGGFDGVPKTFISPESIYVATLVNEKDSKNR